MDVIEKLFSLKDEGYKAFQGALIPTVDSERVIGVRTPQLKSLAREIYGSGEYESFISSLPHRYFEENNLHGFIICVMKDFDTCLSEVERFLPYIDNWATCDQLRPKALSKNKEKLLERICVWIKSDHTYTVRFGLGMLTAHFLDADFRPEFLDLAAGVTAGEYYVDMMLAWFFATALAKQYEATVPYIENRILSEKVHGISIRKACESFRVTDEQKRYLKTLKR